MGLWTLRMGDSIRHCAEVFGQKRLDTVTGSLRTLVLALLSDDIIDEWIKIPSADEPDHPQIKDYSPHVFAGCRGALDGTHIGVKVPKRVRDVYVSGRKDEPTINVFAACNFDFDFIAIYAGVEGSVHDSRVLEMARATGNFAMPPGQYLLGDAGYGLSTDVLTPHRSVKYHTWEPGAV
ncbi:hypothetical protein L198_01743 [Cryptococcus wingfieldii CBS 7118]|uniref:DDE Tnp4 domain-containing protein n=1 Tax=Cryptococcus wingfieldii CBS 7118 TaxID=1295528 RepID=A0A1E3K083_9TREE|nr:hypothetical protein L198_01743 [Cryptococcus wingfieldii CBS 7118]ODO06510.1 hypothetical protein L198_01743 [Cryptococcus wingfieldii CBS 7118]